MNRQRRMKLNQALDTLCANVQNGITDVQSVLDEETDAYESMPENLQSSMRGEEMEENIETLEQFIDTLEELDFSSVRMICG